MKKYFGIFIAVFLSIMIILPGAVAVVDPCFVYHSPLKELYYELDNDRYQNNGIAARFDYDAVITGTSLTENFKCSEFDSLYGTNSVKVPFSGATFYETKETVERGYRSGHNIRYVFRSLDINHLGDEAGALREDLGEYPFYLFNDKLSDDYKYLLNEDTVMRYCIPAIAGFALGKKGGHTSFDEYHSADWRKGGGGWTWKDEVFEYDINDQTPMTAEERTKVLLNVEKNITDFAREHPETTFIYYVPPYNMTWWKGLIQDDGFDGAVEGLEIALEKCLECDNIRVYCYALRTDLTTDLDYYVDSAHYIGDINSEILKWCAAGEDLVTKENYKSYVDGIWDFYGHYEYMVGYRNSNE